MAVIRWILTHLMIIFAAVLVVSGIVYKDEIQVELKELGIIKELVRAESEQKSAAMAAPAAKATTPAPAPVAVAVAPTPAPVAAPAPTPAPAPVAAPAPTPAPARMHSPQPNVRKHPHTQRTHPQQAAQMMQHRSQGHHKSHKNKSSNHHASAPAIDDAVKTKWVAARTAFWRRDLAGAEKLYKELLEASKEADIAGELGNIYLMQRRPKEATDMYFEAANRLLGGEHPMHARKVISTLRRLDPEKAEQVRQKIREHHKTEHGGHTEPAQIKENTK